MKDAARLLHMPQNNLLKSLKRGQVRGTQIGNNWFAYVDADMVEAAARKTARRAEKQESRKKAMSRLQAENEALRADLKRWKKTQRQTKPDDQAVAVPELPDDQPAVDSEVVYLRQELRAMREQHAEEMRRKDILLRQSHQLLEGVVQSGLLTQRPAAETDAELVRLRAEQERSAKLMGDMSSLLAAMYRRLRRAEAQDR